MARINPDPYTGGQVFALVNRVTGLVDTEEEAMAMVRSLEEGGVAPDDIDVFVGEQGARRLDLSGLGQGRIKSFLRRLEGSVGDEREPKRRIEEGLARGGSLVSVKVHKKNGNEKPRAFKILEALHGRELHFWGNWSFEDVPQRGPCVFCTLPAERIVGENEHVMWILDAHPVSPGHSLIIPKRHVESFFDATAAEREAMMALLDQARAYVMRDHAPSGYNIGINEGIAAGQAVPHLHVHLIPRYPGDTQQPRGGIRWVVPEKAAYWTRQTP
jgi:diadenosine tetraphosphate (Ap4A) HIT family hydrolase